MIHIEKDQVKMTYRATRGVEYCAQISVEPGHIYPCAPVGGLSIEQAHEFIRALEWACAIASRQVEIGSGEEV